MLMLCAIRLTGNLALQIYRFVSFSVVAFSCKSAFSPIVAPTSDMLDDNNHQVVLESAIKNGVRKALQIDTPVGHRLEVGSSGIFTNRL